MVARAGEVLIVGGGPAGCVAAALLARGGLRVTLVEAARFPRDKVCGECLSDLALETLAASDLLKPLARLAPVTLRGCDLFGQGGEVASLNLPAQMWGVTRKAMDAVLLDAARSAGAEVVQPARVERVEPGRPPAVTLRDLSAGGVTTRRPDLVLLADGKSLFPGGKPKATGDLGVKAHFRGVDARPNRIALFGVRGHYAGLAPVSDGTGGRLWNLACNVPARRVKAFGGDHDALLRQMCGENPKLKEAFASVERAGPWLACPLPRFAPRGDWPAGVIPLGNAAAALEPVGGEGMGLAIASAARAADFVLCGRTSPADSAALLGQYRRLWRTRRAACRSAAMLLSSPRLGPAAVRLAARWSAVGSLGLRLVGKSPQAAESVRV